MRLIDADALERQMKKELDYQDAYLPIHFEQMMEDTPTVDAEPVIRCKECKYFMCGNGCKLQAVDYSWEEQMYANDFCSRGEKKDE